MAAYPMCEVLAAAAWQQHALAGPITAGRKPEIHAHTPSSVPPGKADMSAVQQNECVEGWADVRHWVLEAGAGSSLGSIVRGLLGQESMIRVATLGGDSGDVGECGVVPNLGAAVFQDLDI